ncbi:MAG TPA: ATP-binding cassette domain-containing protein [Acidimicrobiales bacterium]|nr:ATP-binding cassette domain-containing protein [Acidimicrobiales bacterium]
MSRRSPLAWLGGLLAVYLAVPIVAFVVRLSGSDQRGFDQPGLWSALRTSVESATIATAVIALFGIPLAFALARHHGWLSRLLGTVVVLPLALPPVMDGILLIYLIGPYTTLGRFFDQRLTGSVAGIVISQVFVAAPFLVISARAAFSASDPSLDDLAAAMGHRPVARFFLVDLPVAAVGIRAGLLLTWLRAIGEYGANVIVAYHPFSLPVFTYEQFSASGIPTTQAPTLLVIAAAAVAVLVSQIRLPHRAIALPPAVTPQPLPATNVGFDLDVRAGSFTLRAAYRATSHRLAIIGPSGSGKSITLRSLAGLLGPGVGSVTYGDDQPVREPTEHRQLGYVPQGQTLFPHMTVARQVVFAKGTDPALARYWLDTLGLAGLESRHPHEISGGQRQRVSLAASLARRPRLLLLDEPFSALDTPVREELRQEVRRLQLQGLSTVLVTHDAAEAALLADEVVIVSGGRVLQAGPTTDVYRRPASPEVARVVGFQNIVDGVAEDGGVRSGDTVIATSRKAVKGQAVSWAVRPEHIVPRADGRYPATIVDASDLGGLTVMTIRFAGGPELVVRTWGGPADRFDIDPERVVVWPA